MSWEGGKGRMRLNPGVQDGHSSVLPRKLLLGVCVLPTLLDEARRVRLSDRRELHGNSKLFAPRGRAKKPLERIEVDLIFLRFLDRFESERAMAQRRFVSSQVDMYH